MLILHGILIKRKERGRLFTVTTIHHDHPAMRDFQHIHEGFSVTRVNGRFINTWKHNSALFRYLTKHKIISMETSSPPSSPNVKYFEIDIPTNNDRGCIRVYLFERTRIDSITRMEMLYITSGEIWYLRLILLNCTPISFADAMTHEGQRYRTFQEAAYARGLVTDGEEGRKSFEELAACCIASELRGLFSLMVLHGFPMLNVFNDPELRAYLLEDFLRQGHTMGESINMLLLDLQRRLRSGGGRSLEHYGFPDAVDPQNELERESLLYDRHEQAALLQQLQQQFPNNVEQESAYQEILQCINSPEPLTQSRFFFISGPGGVGKSELCKKLHAAARAEGTYSNYCSSHPNYTLFI